MIIIIKPLPFLSTLIIIFYVTKYFLEKLNIYYCYSYNKKYYLLTIIKFDFYSILSQIFDKKI